MMSRGTLPLRCFFRNICSYSSLFFRESVSSILGVVDGPAAVDGGSAEVEDDSLSGSNDPGIAILVSARQERCELI